MYNRPASIRQAIANVLYKVAPVADDKENDNPSGGGSFKGASAPRNRTSRAKKQFHRQKRR
jgi:hypothetical protein